MLKIGLIDVDSHNFPNLALMKISAYHKKNGDFVEFANMFNQYDITYYSKTFTFSKDDQYKYNSKKIIKGGSGYQNYNIKLDPEIEFITPDYDLYNCDHSYGFLTRGCIRNCYFCVVPQKEGKIKKHKDIDEILGSKKTVVLLDNNVLASDWGLKQIEKIIKKGIKVDFNQGLDARLINNDIAKLLSKVKWLKPLRMSCDSLEMIEYVEKAIILLRKNKVKPKAYFIYLLVTNIDDTLKKIKYLKKYNVDFFAQPFIDFVNKKYTPDEQKKISRWINHKATFNSCDFKDYKG